jgi:hypothetical protein
LGAWWFSPNLFIQFSNYPVFCLGIWEIMANGEIP